MCILRPVLGGFMVTFRNCRNPPVFMPSREFILELIKRQPFLVEM